MKHTNKNHKRRNNKKRPTKKCNRGGGKEQEGEGEGENRSTWGWLSGKIKGMTSRDNSKISENASGNSTDLNASGNSTGLENAEIVGNPGSDDEIVKKLFDELKPTDNKYLTEEQYKNIYSVSPWEFPNSQDIINAAGSDEQIDLHEFAAAYYFGKLKTKNLLDVNIKFKETKEVQKMLSGTTNIKYHTVINASYGVSSSATNRVTINKDERTEITFAIFLPFYYFAKATNDIELRGDGNSAKINEDRYTKVVQQMLPGAKHIQYSDVAEDNKPITFEKFLPIYYFAKASGDDATINEDGYNKLENMLPGAKKIDFEVVAEDNKPITFKQFLPFYYFLKVSGFDANINNDEYAKVKNMVKEKELKKINIPGTYNQLFTFDKFLPIYYFAKASGDDATINEDRYTKVVQQMLPGAAEIPYKQVDKDGNGIDFNEFLPLYYFAKAIRNNGTKLDWINYKYIQDILPKFKAVDYRTVVPNRDGIDFEKFLDKYNELYPPTQTTTGGRRRRKRSTRNKRKTNKKRRTVKRRKSAKRSHRRK